MKIDKRNPQHWAILIKSAIYILIGILTRVFRNRGSGSVVLYGHKLNGNLKAFADFIEQSNENKGLYSVVYATLDPSYYQDLKSSKCNVEVLSVSRLRDAMRIAHADVVITSHGMHILVLLNKLTSMKFVNAWHGVGWKGHMPDEFAFARSYAMNWVTSPTFRDIYRDKFEISSPMEITGYARTDVLVHPAISRQEILEKYNIDNVFDKVVLIAPTWEQKEGGHTILPFGLSADDFFGPLDTLAKENNTLIIFRTHLNSAGVDSNIKLHNTRFMPYGTYPVVEDFLLLADILVTDWSTIAFDYIALNRPVILLDSPCPFEVMSLDETYRFGEVVQAIDALTKSLGKYITSPEAYVVEHGEATDRAKTAAYGDTLDGKSSKRYHESLVSLVNSKW
jgi:CDP-glycerol glycerophosphotransferase (TagB/SpsB family)